MSSAPFIPSPLRLLHRGALTTALLAPMGWAAPFDIHGDGTVTDHTTGLVWDRCPLGRSGANRETGCMTACSWQEAIQAVQVANASRHKGHGDWRLPDVRELQSLVDKSLPGPGQVGTVPSIDATAFPGTPSSGFWSSTAYAPDAGYAWVVDFCDGYTYANDKAYAFHVRLVRGG